MSASGLAAWIFGFAVCTAWLASAAGVGRYRPSSRPAPPAAIDASLATLAADVQMQTARLRDRLAEAPAPSPAQRNPFSFAAPVAPPVRPPVTPATTAPPAMPDLPPAEPALILIGVAEMPGAGGPVRTAMITGPSGDLLMVTVGQTLAGRYEVAGIAADAVQLKDTSSGSVRTLVLR